MHRGAFVDLVTRGEPGLEALLISLATEFGHATGDGAVQALRNDRAMLQIERLTAALAGVEDLPPAMQLQLLSSLVFARFDHPAVEPHRVDFGDLRPDVVLDDLAGHPIVVASAVAAVAQRAGLPIGVVTGDHSVLLAHHVHQPPLAISIDHQGQVLDARELRDPGLQWRCAHEVSSLILDLVAQRAETLGLRPVAVRACELSTSLPLDPTSLVQRETELRRARSAWN